MATRIGVDVGGTFTDLIFYDHETGEIRVGKVPTTPQSPEQGVVHAVSEAVPEERVSAAGFFLHGTTVGLNSLLERRGAIVGLLATKGFRDVLEIRRGDRDDVYNLFWSPPPPLVPRRLRLPVGGRILAEGRVHTPLEAQDVRNAVEIFEAEGVTCVAVAFINSYANPEHELEAEQLLREAGYAHEIALSHRISREYREYERTCTTVVDAYVRPRMVAYLRHLEDSLRGLGFKGSLLVTRSGGGSMTFAEAEARPVETILSGPVAGAEGAAELARNLAIGDVIAADVGGTSFDTCLISNGRPQLMYEGNVVGLPIQTPWVDVRSIGAGGGSIAYVDEGGLLKVGPRSAGADPGPAAYGKGGTEPTATDAALVLGMLGEGRLASGITLDREKARAALIPVAEGVGLEIEETARGVLTILTANMANAIREITVEQGHDPRRLKLVMFGGAGPLFATLLAHELEMNEVIVPPYAGNFSAWGLLGADLTQTSARTSILRLTDESLDSANVILGELFAELDRRTESSDEAGNNGHTRGVGLDMRYVGQEHSLTVNVDSSDGRINLTAQGLYELFTREYGRAFAHTMAEPAEIVSVRASNRAVLPRRTERYATRTENGVGTSAASADAYSFSRAEWLPFAIVDRDAMPAGTETRGPMIIVEQTATTYVDMDFDVRIDDSGCIFLSDTRDR